MHQGSKPGTEPLLNARGVAKRYGAVRALEDADMAIRAGEVVALLGANGSGKSTLGKIITGITRPDAGTLTFDGAPLHLTEPAHARRLGITAVYQELSLAPDLSVAENVWLGHEPVRWGGIDRRALRERTAELLKNLEGVFTVPVEPDTLVDTLPPSERQLVEVVKALAWRPRVLVLDEATASLDARQVDRLFELVHAWRDRGMAVAFVSHRMNEIFRVADRAVVLRNGVTVGERRITEATEQELVELMTGGGEVAALALEEVAAEPASDAEAAPTRPKREKKKPAAPRPEASPSETAAAAAAPVLLELRRFGSGELEPLDLTLHRGELVGVGGLQGQGQSRLLLALFGAVPHQGEVVLAGERVAFRNPRQAMRAGVAYVPGDRNREGLLPIRPILENLQLPNWRRYGMPLRMKRAEADADAVVTDLAIKLDSLAEPVANLSGGNAQKVVIGKWLLRDPQLLLLDDPTKGVDVNAKAEFYRLLARLQADGTTILFHSSDDAELLGLCERVIVMQDGRVTATLEGETLDQAHLVAAAMGATGAGAA